MEVSPTEEVAKEAVDIEEKSEISNKGQTINDSVSTFTIGTETVKSVMNQKYKKDNDLNLSDLEEEQRNELIDLEDKIENGNLSRGERRRL